MSAQGRTSCEQREHLASPWVTGPPTFVALKGHNMSEAQAGIERRGRQPQNADPGI